MQVVEELGMIKAIQTLSEVRITDVISALTKCADHLTQDAPASVYPTTTPVAAPAPKPASSAQKSADTLSSFDALIESAPEEDEKDIQVALVATPKAEIAAYAPGAEATQDNFEKDPLIQAALLKFEADFVKKLTQI